MKAIKLALTGLLTLATFATAHRGEKANDGVNLPQPGGIHWDNKMFTYHCKGNTVTQCDPSSKWVPLQICKHGYTELESRSGIHGAGCDQMSMNHVADDAVEKVEQRNEVPQGVHGDGDIHWDDKVSSYHCKDNTVTQCNSIPECTVVEICQDGCTEHNRQPGLHGAGCGTMRIWEGDDKPAPALTKRNDPSTGYDNDGTFIYVCNAKNEIEECTDFAPSKCIVKESCPRGCFQKPNGALCVDRSLPPVPRHVPSPATAEDKSSIDQSTADDCGNGSTKCKKCTSDWRGVLTCQYGFCYVVPGDWCPADKICRESCNCCRKFKKFGKRDAMPLLEGPAGTPPSSDKDATPSKTPAPHDPAPVSDMVPTPTNTTARCIPGHYYCTKAGKPDILLVCTLQQFFRVSATCAKDSSCYEGLERGTAYCGLPPKQAAPGLEVRTDTSSLDGTLSSHHAKMEASKTVDAPAKRQILSPVPIPSGGVCPPGIYACGTADYDNIDDGSAIFVCNTSGQWIFAAKCCGVNTCVTDWSHGTAHCTC